MFNRSWTPRKSRVAAERKAIEGPIILDRALKIYAPVRYFMGAKSTQTGEGTSSLCPVSLSPPVA